MAPSLPMHSSLSLQQTGSLTITPVNLGILEAMVKLKQPSRLSKNCSPMPSALVKMHTLNSAYNEVAFNEKLAIMKENLHTKYTPFTYNDIFLNEKPPIMKQNLHVLFFSL